MAKKNGTKNGAQAPEAESLAAMLEAAPDAMLVVDQKGTVVRANQLAEAMFEREPGELAGVDVSELISQEDRGDNPLTQKLERGEAESQVELTAERASGERFPVELTLRPLEGEDGSLVMVAIRDATSRKQVEEQLKHLAERDPLTGLFNRRRFEEELIREVDRSGRYGGGALVMVDIDNFKYVNDSYGHKAGDTLISAVADLLSERLRGSDVIARLGGDEFAIVLPTLSLEGARAAGENLRQIVNETEFAIDGHNVQTSLSVGLAPLGDPELTADEAMARADLAMYQAKEAGRNRVAVYRATGHEQMRARVAWSERIRKALDEGRMVAHFQPVLELRQNEVSQWELLARIRNEDGELIVPNSFIPSAERFGMIAEIDRWAIREAIDVIARHDQNGDGKLRVEVNLSARSVDDPQLLDEIEAGIEERGIDPSSLIFEVTETAAIGNVDRTVTLADALAEIGCGFALDDFGTGFGSFYYLRRLPLTYLKIDGAFIQNLTRSAVDQLVVRAVVDVARGFGLRIGAEFVGDSETLRMLRGWGVDYAQGFHVGRPGPIVSRD